MSSLETTLRVLPMPVEDTPTAQLPSLQFATFMLALVGCSTLLLIGLHRWL